MLAWSEGTDNGRQKTRNHGYDARRRRAAYWLSIHPRKLVTLNPKLKSTGAGRYQLLFRWWDAYRKQLGLKDFSPKSQTLWHCRLRSVALYLWLIVVISVRQSTVAAISGLHCRAGYGRLEHKADSLIAKFKEAGGTVREIDVWAESLRLSPLWLSVSSSACHGLLIITVITPLPTKQRDKNARELKSSERGNYWHADASAWCCCARDAKYTKELADAKAEKFDALRDDVAAGRRRLHISSLSVSAWSHHRLRRG